MEEDGACRSKQNNLKLRKIVLYILGTFEVLFAFRMIFKLFGASPENNFISFIYTISDKFLTPFSGFFRIAVNKGIGSESVLDSTTIIVMIVYAIIAYGVISLFETYEIPKERGIR